MPAKKSSSPLLYADTRTSADALYFGGVGVPDPFVSFGHHGKKYGVVGALEFGRVRKQSNFDVVLPLENYLRQAKELWPQRRVGPAEVICLLAREFKQRSFTVSDDFPAGLYEKLFELGLDIAVAEGVLFPQREIKTADEAEAIRAGNRASAAGIAAAEKMLRESQIKGRRLLHGGKPLTSERLKFAIEVACLEAGAISSDTIAAGGDQACDPHDRGSGPLFANQLIVVDVFPRMAETGYYGDMTRTFLRGEASDAQRALVAAVRTAQKGAIAAVTANVNGRDIHRGVVAVFEKQGFKTEHGAKGSIGFFHGTGHGLGLQIHELPRISGSIDYILKKGSVVTVEPGLYYPGLGGCRIEDVVQVTATKPKMLSRFHYEWELR